MRQCAVRCDFLPGLFLLPFPPSPLALPGLSARQELGWSHQLLQGCPLAIPVAAPPLADRAQEGGSGQESELVSTQQHSALW